METPAPARTTSRPLRSAFSNGFREIHAADSHLDSPHQCSRRPGARQYHRPDEQCLLASLASSLFGNTRHVVSYRQHPNPTPAFVNHD